MDDSLSKLIRRKGRMGKMRKTHDGAYKAKIALEAVKGGKTVAQLASETGVHPNQVGQWKKRLLEELPFIFSASRVVRTKAVKNSVRFTRPMLLHN